MITREWQGEQLRLRADLAALFDQALAMYEAEAAMDDIMQVLNDRASPVWLDDRGNRITTEEGRREAMGSPVYRAIKAMARRRGIAAGLLSETRPGTQPNLDDFLIRVPHGNN